MKKALLLIISFFLLAACGPKEADYKSKVPLAERVTENMPGIPDKPEELPGSINLDVTFFPQAPEADWNMPWQEACEEASVVQAVYYAKGKPLSKEAFKEEILNLVEWQIQRFGDYKHTTIHQTAEIVRDHFDYKDYEIMENPTVGSIKKELSDHHVIVAPFAGKLLGNPFYSNEGPNYHMLVIKGYDDKNFITNDVGTRRGENFIYPQNKIMSSMHDYVSGDITTGPKRVLVIKSR